MHGNFNLEDFSSSIMGEQDMACPLELEASTGQPRLSATGIFCSNVHLSSQFLPSILYNNRAIIHFHSPKGSSYKEMRRLRRDIQIMIFPVDGC